MRNAILQLPETRTANEKRQVLRTAMRQLERADLYLAAVAYMDLGDREAQRALKQVRGDLAKLGRYLGERRNLDSDGVTPYCRPAAGSRSAAEVWGPSCAGPSSSRTSAPRSITCPASFTAPSARAPHCSS